MATSPVSDYPVQDRLPNQRWGIRRHEQIGVPEVQGLLVGGQKLHGKLRDIFAHDQRSLAGAVPPNPAAAPYATEPVIRPSSRHHRPILRAVRGVLMRAIRAFLLRRDRMTPRKSLVSYRKCRGREGRSARRNFTSAALSIGRLEGSRWCGGPYGCPKQFWCSAVGLRSAETDACAVDIAGFEV